MLQRFQCFSQDESPESLTKAVSYYLIQKEAHTLTLLRQCMFNKCDWVRKVAVALSLCIAALGPAPLQSDRPGHRLKHRRTVGAWAAKEGNCSTTKGVKMSRAKSHGLATRGAGRSGR
ncbi:hypothetical protein FKM82_011698 [Ascaphus truei]